MSKLKRVDKVRWPGVYFLEITKGGKPDITYYITFRDGQKKVWEKIGAKSEGLSPQVAADIRHDRMVRVRHGEQDITARQQKKAKAKSNKPFDKIADAYLEQRGGAVTAKKIDRYRYDKHIDPVIGTKPVANITELDIKKIKNNMAELSPASIWAVLELVRRIANYGKRVGISSGGLKFKMPFPKVDNEVVQFLTPEEASRLLKVLDDWPSPDVANMLRLAMFSGMRRGELFKLKDTDLDFNNKLIKLDKPKGGKSASIPMNPIAEKILHDQIAWRNDRKEPRKSSPYLFPGKWGDLRVECKAADRIKVKAKLPKEFRIFHGLRHHFAVTLANSGEFSIDMIGELLTHKSHQMTKRYAAYLPDSMKKAGNRAAELLQQHVDKREMEGQKEFQKNG